MEEKLVHDFNSTKEGLFHCTRKEKTPKTRKPSAHASRVDGIRLDLLSATWTSGNKPGTNLKFPLLNTNHIEWPTTGVTASDHGESRRYFVQTKLAGGSVHPPNLAS